MSFAMASPGFDQLLKTYTLNQIITMVNTASQFNAATTTTALLNMAGKSVKNKAVHSRTNNAKTTRPLNSWMAFRGK